MTGPVVAIRRRTRAAGHAFDRLREEGLRWLQSAGGQVWTDHNLHDPGITLLEQLCFALTDLSYRADFPVADHLAGPDGRIAWDALSLPPPSTIFPCRATTAQDYRRLLIDAVPGLDDATLAGAARDDATAAASELPHGVYRLTLKLSPGDTATEPRRIAQARAAYRRERNLGEDLDDTVLCVRDVEVELLGELDLGGPRNPVDVLAEGYDRCARHIARVPRTISHDEALRAGRTLQETYTGPRTRRGVPAATLDAAPGGDQLFLADLAALVQGIAGVVHAHLRALRIDSPGAAGAGADASSLQWAGEGWALRLRVPLDARDGAGIAVKYRGHEVAVDPQALRLRYADLQAGDIVQRAAGRDEPPPRDLAILPQGVHRPPAAYLSVEASFPATYHLGRNGLPPSASAQDRARLRQYKAYLRLFDHVIANGVAQVGHLRELFSLNGGSAQSYWHQDVVHEDGGVSDALLLGSPEAVRQAVHAPFDRGTKRKSRALDHLLALHGVTYRQDSMRKFATHLDAAELEDWLLENKAEYLRDIVVLGRDRAGGFDYSRPAWDDPGNCSGLQQRASLQMGFRLSHARSLSQVLGRQRITLSAADAVDESTLLAPKQIRGLRRIGRVAAAATQDQMQADLQRIAPLRSRVLPPVLMRAGVRHDLYALAERPGDRDGETEFDLLLGPDEAGRWWPLGSFADAASASRAAGSARRFLRRLNENSEGMHIVEHVLLRPVGGAPRDASTPSPDPSFYAARLTVVLPGWTARTHRPAFRRFAEDTLRNNCPAHLALECRWLEFDALQRFEQDLERWMQARQAYCSALDENAAARPERASALDRAARRIVAHIGGNASAPSYDDMGAPGHA